MSNFPLINSNRSVSLVNGLSGPIVSECYLLVDNEQHCMKGMLNNTVLLSHNKFDGKEIKPLHGLVMHNREKCFIAF